MAGVVGVDPGPFTLRELDLLAEGRSRAAWNHTSALLAMLFNIHRDPKTQNALSPAHFNPHIDAPPVSPRGKVSAAQFADEVMMIAEGKARKAKRAAEQKVKP